MKVNTHKLITVLNTQFIHEVQIAQSKLELDGIPSFILDENLTSTIGTAFVEGYKLQVDSSYANKAKTIIDSIAE